MINIEQLSTVYSVRKLNDNDINDILNIMDGNPTYFKYCPPLPSVKTIKEDMLALPPHKDYNDKYYIGLFEKELICVIDLIDHYPNEDSLFIGFFMINKKYQKQGIGSFIIKEIENYCLNKYHEIRLGYVKDNKESESFWIKNGFKPTGVISHQELYDVVVMSKTIS